MKLNASKTKIMVVSRPRNASPVTHINYIRTIMKESYDLDILEAIFDTR